MMIDIAENILLLPSEWQNYYRKRYALYNKLNIPLDIFFPSDIINHDGFLYGYYYSFKLRSIMTLNHDPKRLNFSFRDRSKLNNGKLDYNTNEYIICHMDNTKTLYVYDWTCYNDQSLLHTVFSKIAHY